jgi:Trypsin-like peptidase domain
MSFRKLSLTLLLFLGCLSLAPGQSNDTHQASPLFDSVVTVWSEFGHGTGFIVDSKGLILTNARTIGPSEIIAIQFDPQHKVRATLLAADPEKDLAVLWASLAPCPTCVAAPLATTADGKPSVVVAGVRLVAVSSPLGPLKLTTDGEVSSADAQSITSDIETTPWISGGPVFNSHNLVVGITSAAAQTTPGHGPSNIIPIAAATALLDQARTKLGAATGPPPAILLPVESADVFPRDGLEQVMEAKKFDIRPYFFDEGDYRVFFATPTSIYRFRTELKNEEEKRRAKHKGNSDPVPDVTEIWGLKNWSPYLAEYTPVVEIVANAKLRETTGSLLGRALTGGSLAEPWRIKFKADFYKMKLRCGEKEVQPIQTGKIEELVDNAHHFTKITNSSSKGFYSYPPDAISPSCGQVALEIYSTKDPDKATVKVLDPKTVDRIWSDFEPYRKTQAAASKPKSSD